MLTLLATMSTLMMMMLSCLMQLHCFCKGSKARRKKYWEDFENSLALEVGNKHATGGFVISNGTFIHEFYSLERLPKMCWKSIQLPTFSIITLSFRLSESMHEERLEVAETDIGFNSHKINVLILSMSIKMFIIQK